LNCYSNVKASVYYENVLVVIRKTQHTQIKENICDSLKLRLIKIHYKSQNNCSYIMFFGHHKYHAEHLPVVYSCINTTLFYLYFIACHYRLKDLECPQDNGAASPPRIIDESWLFGQVSGSASTWDNVG